MKIFIKKGLMPGIGFIAMLLFINSLMGCGGRSYYKSPIDNFVTQLDSLKAYSVILYDMEAEPTYRHQYKIIAAKGDTPEETKTDWYEVEEDFFWEHENNLGMEVLSKTEDGKIHKTAAPPGYNNYVGNDRYGHWVNRGGSSFWEFYGQYAFMSSMFNLATMPVRRSYYDDYRSNYYDRRPYYGPTSNGRSTYGTYGQYTQKTRPSGFQRKLTNLKQKSTDFKQRVSNRTNRSNSRSNTTTRRSTYGGK